METWKYYLKEKLDSDVKNYLSPTGFETFKVMFFIRVQCSHIQKVLTLSQEKEPLQKLRILTKDQEI